MEAAIATAQATRLAAGANCVEDAAVIGAPVPGDEVTRTFEQEAKDWRTRYSVTYSPSTIERANSARAAQAAENGAGEIRRTSRQYIWDGDQWAEQHPSAPLAIKRPE
jgi:hypothetical protein